MVYTTAIFFSQYYNFEVVFDFFYKSEDLGIQRYRAVNV